MYKSLIVIITLLAILGSGCAKKEYRESKIRVQHPKWDSTTIRKVAAREIEPGMTPDMVKAALGLPDAISRTGGEEAWQYQVFVGDYQPRKETVYTVYFKEGAVTRTAGNKNRLKTLSWDK
jgi:outer membrane protein assembly factor BamE (lipoprotein component of BamABCDE complex)